MLTGRGPTNNTRRSGACFEPPSTRHGPALNKQGITIKNGAKFKRLNSKDGAYYAQVITITLYFEENFALKHIYLGNIIASVAIASIHIVRNLSKRVLVLYHIHIP